MAEEAGAVTDRTSQWRKYDSYMVAFKGNQVNLDSDFTCCDDDSAIAEYYEFEPARILQILIERAMALNISPDNFHKDMKFLIKSEKEAANFKDQRISEKWYNDFLDLQEKYGVKSASKEPYSVTLSRIRFIFPHYTIKYHNTGEDIFLGWNGGNQIRIPYLFSIPEFGALIPIGRILKEDMREALIILHLYCLKSKKKSVFGSNLHFRTRQVFLKRNIHNSLLSDERKVTFLQKNGVLDRDGALQSSSQKAIDCIREKKNDFLEKISWNLIN